MNPGGSGDRLTSVSRLPSLKGTRDLNLTRGGAQKRTFVPKIPTRREKPDLPVAEEIKPVVPVVARDEGRGRGRGRGNKADLKQTSSIFDQGPVNRVPGVNDKFRRPPAGSASEKNSRAGAAKDSISTWHNDESTRMDIDDSELVPFNIAPLAIYLKDSHVPVDLPKSDDSSDSKSDSNHSTCYLTGTFPIAAQPHDFKSADFFLPMKQEEKKLLLLDTAGFLPLLPLETKPVDASGDSTKICDDLQASRELYLDPVAPKMFQDGFLGTMRVHRSGRVSFLLGNAVYDVDLAPNPNQEDLLSIHPEQRSCYNLGRVSHHGSMSYHSTLLQGHTGEAMKRNDEDVEMLNNMELMEMAMSPL